MTLNHNAMQAFDVLEKAYAEAPGDSMPAPPMTWAAAGQPPSQSDLDTPFGHLYTAVVQAVDANRPGSAVDSMNHVAWALGLSTPP
jgi:hypothetical protein